MKLIKIVFLILSCFGLVIYLFFPWHATDRAYWEPAWWQKSLFNFCKYKIPDDYQFISYGEGAPGHEDERYLIILKSKNTDQKIFLLKLRGFHFIPFDQIQIDPSVREIREPLRFDDQIIQNDFRIITHLPVWHFLRQDAMEKLPSNLLVKGIQVEDKEEYPTDKARVFYLKGSFTKIGFFKNMPFPWGFATPVLDFLAPQKGVLAILNNKEANETIIVTCAVPSHKTFDEETFKKFIQSISFDKEVYKSTFLEGIQQDEIKTKTKISF